MEQAELSMDEAHLWADALALLVENGQPDGPLVLLSRLTDRVTAERVRQALLGRLRAAEERFTAEVNLVFRTAIEVPAGELPGWAESGIADEVGRRVFGKHTLDLDAVERADGVAWPAVTVMVLQVSGEAACVLVEIGPDGTPLRITGHQARRVGGALLAAADLVDEVNS
jgi:hypothetical protein